MRTRHILAACVIAAGLAPLPASAQINFPITGYYAGAGDSVAAGEGALPVTNGYVYQLYDHGVFGQKTEMHFANVAVRGARSWELKDNQVPQLLCTEPSRRPTVVTITAGANDFLRGDTDIFGIARRVADAVGLLLNNASVFGSLPIIDPVTQQPCKPLAGVTILVSNYYSIPHPVPDIAAQLNAALNGFDLALRFWLTFVPVPAGSRVEVVDLYQASFGKQGLVTIERRLGYSGPFDFDVHPTNLGHTFIAGQFEQVWMGLE